MRLEISEYDDGHSKSIAQYSAARESRTLPFRAAQYDMKIRMEFPESGGNSKLSEIIIFRMKLSNHNHANISQGS